MQPKEKPSQRQKNGTDQDHQTLLNFYDVDNLSQRMGISVTVAESMIDKIWD